MTVPTPRRTGHPERGISALGYIGMAIIAALALGLIILALGGDKLPVVRDAMCRVVKTITQQDVAGCAATTTTTGQQSDRKPGACKLTEKGEKVTSQISIAFIKIGENSGFIETKYSDGSVKLTATDGGNIGVTGGVGGSVKLGDAFQSTKKVDFGGGLTFESGETWTFKSQAEADAMRKQIDDYLWYQYQLTHPICSPYSGVCMMQPNIKQVDKPQNGQTEITTKIGGKFEAKAELSAKDNIPIPPPPGAGTGGATAWQDPKKAGGSTLTLAGVVAKGSIEPAYVERLNQATGETTRTEELKLSGSINGTVVNATIGARGVYGQSISLKRNKDGQLIEFSIVTTLEGGINGSALAGGKGPGGNGGTVSETIDPTKATVTTTTLKLDPSKPGYADQVKIIEDWYHGNPDDPNASVLTSQHVEPTQRVPGDALQNLLFDSSTTSSIEYQNVTNKDEFALNIKLGLAFGFEFGIENSQSTATAAQYLGPTTNGSRSYLPFTDCIK